MQNPLLWPRTDKTLIGLVCLMLGYLFGRGIEFQYFGISQDINLVEVASLAVTAWAAYHVGNVLARRNENIRVEKDLILVQLSEVETLMREGIPEILAGSISLTKVAALFKKLGINLSRISKNLDLTGMEFPEEIKILHESRKKLRELCTDSPPISDSSDIEVPIEIRDGIINFSKKRLLEIEGELEVLYSKIFELKVKVNRR